MAYHSEQVRLLTGSDVHSIERLMRTSEYVYQRFTLAELPLLLKRYPTVGLFHDTSLHGFLLSQITNESCAWIGGFGVSWTESKAYFSIFTTLLDQLAAKLVARSVRYLHYSGNDPEGDWLRALLLKRGFLPYRRLYAYDKFDCNVPTEGNQQVVIRPINLTQGANGDMAALLAIEEACFEDLWRYDSVSFTDIAATHPYFVVAELNGRVVGYQFNTLEGDAGYLIRIAVHPSVNGQGIGARLMAEAMRFFKQANVSRIMLNTQEDNYHAHRLYEWFGFIRLQPIGFVLRKSL
ncbi:MAG TPA: GNAT family N-acetyltransferase [Ktedonobacteraceae bacterium]|nr:GNAT family N-acetyltransferase [Ktedonobacteraceae bacterium]